MELNQSQADAYYQILQFCGDPNRKSFILSGAPGTGKSFLINYMVDHLQNDLKSVYVFPPSIQFSATTNSAVDNVNTGMTIHRALGLIPNRETRKLKQIRNAVQAQIYIIDEYTLIDWDLAQYIAKLPTDSKIIYVGDVDQLLAVGGMEYKLANRSPDFQLDIPMRSKSESILQTCEVFRSWVRNSKDMQELDLEGMPDVQAISVEDFDNILLDPDTDWSDSRVITHTNKKAIAWNQLIRMTNGLPKHFTIGERVSNNTYKEWGENGIRNSVGTDAEFVVGDVYFDNNTPVYTLVGRGAFTVREGFLDLRSSFCSTIYKAQGRSFDTVYIDLSGFPKNTSRSVLTRSLYVGASRARTKIVFIGNLSDHLWSII